MPTIPAENIDINIHDGIWRLFETGENVSSQPVFQVVRGGGVMEYTPGFGQAHKLPGTVLSVEYVRAVVIGYQDKSRRWLLGLHIARSPSEDPPHWLELIRWPSGDNVIYGAAAQQAGGVLAEYIGCPLKIFGAKKLTRPAEPGGVTGPLVPHKRDDIGPQQVKLLAQGIKLPLEYPHMSLVKSRAGVTLRLAKEATASKRGEIAPAYNHCVIDMEQATVRLLPPTGMLGAFLGGQPARVVKAADVRNVELRHTLRRLSTQQEDAHGLFTEVSLLTHFWDIYLTLPDESLLLAQTSHNTSSELARQRAVSADKFAVNVGAGIEYLRRHREDQEAYDAAAAWAESAALVIAATLGVRLAKTEVEEGSV